MSFQMNTFSPFDLTNICQDTYLGKMFRSISIMYFWRFVIKFSWNKKLLELKKNAIKLKFCCLTMVFLYIPGFLPQAWNMPYPRRKAICKKNLGKIGPLEYASHMQCPGVQNWSTNFWNKFLFPGLKLNSLATSYLVSYNGIKIEDICISWTRRCTKIRLLLQKIF